MQKKIRQQFADESSVELAEFLRKDKYDEVTAALQDAGAVPRLWFGCVVLACFVSFL